jgi:hypothetical protein
VFLESAGRDDAITPVGIEGAVGLTQILAETGTNLLDMRVDTRLSARYSRRIARAAARGRAGEVERLRLARARADERFDPVKALAGTARYLTLARETLGREDLAFVSYHMGIGNLQGVLSAFGGSDDTSYAELYFDSTPNRRAAAFARLAGLGDDSSNYYWKVLAGREIMRLWREDRPELDRLASLHEAKGSAERSCTPTGRSRASATPSSCARPGTAATSSPSRTRRASPGSRATGAWASWPSASASPPASTAGCGRRRSPWRSTSEPRCGP